MIWHFAPCPVALHNPHNVSADRPCALPSSFARLPFVPFDLPVHPAWLSRLASRAPVALRPVWIASRFRLLVGPLAGPLLVPPLELDRGEGQPPPARRAVRGSPSCPVEPEASPAARQASPAARQASAQRAQRAHFSWALPRFWEHWSEAHRCQSRRRARRRRFQLPIDMSPRKTARLPPLSIRTNVRAPAEFPARCGFTHFSGSSSNRSAERYCNKSRRFARLDPRQGNAFAEVVDAGQRLVKISGGFHAAAANVENNIPGRQTTFSSHAGGIKVSDHETLDSEAKLIRGHQRQSDVWLIVISQDRGFLFVFRARAAFNL